MNGGTSDGVAADEQRGGEGALKLNWSPVKCNNGKNKIAIAMKIPNSDFVFFVILFILASRYAMERNRLALFKKYEML